MKINFPATKQKMRDTGLNLTLWAKRRGHSPVTLLAILRGDYPSYEANGPKMRAIVKDLSREGYLVEEEDETEKAA